MESTSSLLALITRVPTSPSRSSADSMLISSSCWSASTSTAGPTASSASPIVSFSSLSVPARLLSDSSALMMSVFCWSSVPTTPSSEPSIDRSRSSRPDITRFASRVIVPSCATPPPLSRNDSAPSTSSTSGLRPVAARAMVSPFPRRPSDSSSGGASRATYFSPSNETWRISATALSGSTTLSFTRIVTRACQPTRSTSVTSPTTTSSTITGDRGTTLSTSAKSADTSKESSLSTGEPGSGRS